MSDDRPIRVRLARRGIEIEVPANQTILDALLENAVEIDSFCREGLCGTCETRVLGGIVDHRDSLLDADERAAGNSMMVCVSRALTPELELDL